MRKADYGYSSIVTRNAYLYNILQYLMIGSFILLYIYNISKYFWTLPLPSDPLVYLGHAVWGNGYWPCLDRINLALNLRLFSLLFSGRPEAGMIYVGFVNTLILIISVLWAFRKSGFWAAIFVGIFLNTSYLMLGWATYLYPDQTVALYSLLAFASFFSGIKIVSHSKLVFIAGLFVAFAIFTKITGIALLLFFLPYITYKKNWLELKNFIIGVIAGSIVVIVLFCLIYSVEAFYYTLHLFFKTTISDNLNIPYRNACPYFETVLSIIFFPFIALFIAIGAYKNMKSKYLFILSGVFVIFVNILRYAGPPVPTYIYSAYVFCALGLSIYLGDVLQRKGAGAVYDSIYVKFIFSILCILLIEIGLRIGFRYSPVMIFRDNYSYLYPLDIYYGKSVFSGGTLEYRKIIIILYTYMPIIIIGLLSFIEFSKSRKATMVFAIFVSFFVAFLNGGLSYKKAGFDRENAQGFYTFVPLLNKVPANKFSIYLSNWGDVCYPGRVLWVYRTFFDKKYERGSGIDAQAKNERLITASIKILYKKEDLLNVTGEQILTDDPSAVLEFYPNAKVIKEFYWKDRKLFVFQK